MNATVTSSHHFSEGVKLVITNGKCQWYVDSEKQKHKYGTGMMTRKTDEVSGLVNPAESLDQFIKLINLIFEFTGCCVAYWGEVEDSLLIDSKEDLTQWDIIKTIYDTKLEHKVNFVHIGTCGCNMGNCGAITSVTVDEIDYETYGDLMKLFGYPVADSHGNIYYCYPDSVWFMIRQASRLPETIHKGNSCYSETIKHDKQLDSEKVYLQWEFTR